MAYQRPRRVMDENVGRGLRREAFETETHRILARRTTGHRIEEVIGRRRRIIKRPVLWPDDDANWPDARMAIEDPQ